MRRCANSPWTSFERAPSRPRPSFSSPGSPSGAAVSAGAEIDLGDAHSVSAGYMENEKSTLVWNVPRLLMGKNKVKLLLNLLLIANQCVPARPAPSRWT